MAFDLFQGYVPDPNTPASIYDVQARQKMAEKLLGQSYIPDSGPLGALAEALSGTVGGYENKYAAQESQAGSTQAQAALAKALGGGYDAISKDPSAYVSALGNSFLNPTAAQGAGAYMGTQAQLAQQSAENAAVMARQVQQQQFGLHAPQLIQGYPGMNIGVGTLTGGPDGGPSYTPLNVGGTQNGPPPGTTGSASVDTTADGYSSKIIPGVQLTQAAIDQRALSYLTSGTQPPTGRTGIAQMQSAAIANRMAELAPGGNLAANKANLGSLSQSLGVQQKYADNTERAFNTANDTLAALQSYMAKNNINPSQFPDFNTFSNFLKAHGQDPGAAGGYNAQLQTLRSEYSQVLAKGGQRSVETDRAASQLIPDGLSPAQLAQVAAQIKIDSENAINEAKAQVKQIADQINGVNGVSSASPAPDATTPPAPMSVDDLVKKYSP